MEFVKLSTTMDVKDTIVSQPHLLGMSTTEATVYMHILERQGTILELRRRTDIARTTLYHIVNQLEKRSLIMRQTNG